MRPYLDKLGNDEEEAGYIEAVSKLADNNPLPHADFGLKLLEANLMSIPGVYRIDQELIKDQDQVANLYLAKKPGSSNIYVYMAKALRRPVGNFTCNDSACYEV